MAKPEQGLSELPLLTEAEKHQILVEWNETKREYPLDKCIPELFEEQVERTPDSVAVVFEDQQLTYRELNVRANQLAHYLQRLGVGLEVLVGICVERSLEMVVGVLGVLKAGGAYVPLDPKYPKERLAFMLEDTQTPVLLAQTGVLNQLPEHLAKVVCIDRDWEEITRESDENPTSGVMPENLAYILFTSGSTGRPKGVAIESRCTTNFIQWVRQTFKSGGLRTVLAATSLNFDLAVFELFTPLSDGGRVILIENAIHLTSCAQAKDVKLINTVPSVMVELLRLGGAIDSVHTVNLAGERLRKELVQKLYDAGVQQVFNLYGPTETTTYSTCALIQETESGSPSIGRPIANTQVYILDSHLQPVPIGVPGELHIGGAGLARGYLNDPDLTAEKFIPNPYSEEPGMRLYKSGDLARYLPDGNIEFLGRVDDQVKIRGFRIELGEIEGVLGQHSQVRNTVVLAREDMPNQKRLVAYVVPKDGQNLTLSDVRGFLKEKLPEYMIPSQFVFLETLPLTPNGKVDRRALPTPDMARPDLRDTYVAPRTPTEEIVAGIWAEVLGFERVGVYDNFFDLGGNSLGATQVISRVREAFQVELPLFCLFEFPTITQIGHILGKQHTVQPAIPLCTIRPVRRDRELPLSFSQEQVWFIQQLQPGNKAYHFQATLRFMGSLDLVSLSRSLSEIVWRHEIYRTTFPAKVGRPIQVVHQASPASLPVVDLQYLPKNAREAEARSLMEAEFQKPFDVTQLPLIRWMLLRLDTQQHILVHVEHHLVHDGWSFSVFVRELLELYEAFSSGKLAHLPELTIQFADFANWQRELMKGEMLQTQLAYWKERLGGVPTLLDLPTDRPRPASQSLRGAEQRIELPLQLCKALRTMSQQEGVTLFMTLLAAFKTLLHRYSGQEDICVGSGIANRRLRETEQLIGMLINTIVLRTDLSGDPTFRELLKRVRDVCLGAYAHQDLPFEKLVEELQPERSLSYNPLFQVSFNFHDSPMPNLVLSGLSIHLVEALNNGSAKFDLNLTIIPRSEQRINVNDGAPPEGMTAIWVYSTDLFDASTLTRMVGHWQTLLEGIVANPGQRLSELPLLEEAEKHQLLVGWNNTQRDCPQDQCIHELFEEQAERTPDVAAVVFEDQQLTYRELNARANQLAHYLRKLGVGPEVLVGICVERSLEMLVGVLGILKVGGAYVPLDPAYPKERLRFMLEDTQAPVLLTQARLVEQMPEYRGRVICLDTDWKEIAQWSDENPTSGVMPENLAYVIYTSGSTGKPKGVLIKHRGVCNLTNAQIAAFDISPESRVLQYASFGFDASVSEVFTTLVAGASLYLARHYQILPGLALINLLRDREITTITFPPSVLEVLRPEDLPALRTLVVAGDTCSADLVSHWAKGRRFINAYGPTEGTVCATLTECTRSDQRPPIGRPISNTQVYILDVNLRPVPIGVPGELHIAGVGLARGYLHQPDLTAAKFIPNPFSDEPGALLYKTGDLARYLPDGNIEFLGRIDNQVKIRGFRIELGEIEAVLREHSGVQETVVLAREDAPGQERLVAYIVPNQNQTPGVIELRHFLQKKLPDHMIPVAFVMLKALPLMPNGKVNRHALPIPEHIGDEREQTLVAPRTPVEEWLAKLWSQVLGLKQVGIHDNFFALGGDSIQGAILIAMIQEQLEEYVYVVALFDAPTIAQLATYFNEHYSNALNKRLGLDAKSTVLPLSEKVLPAHVNQLRQLFVPLPCRQAGAVTKNRSAIFVLSPPRSGTTLFRVILGGHPRLFAPPELELLSFNTLQERKNAFSGRYGFWLEGTIRAIMQIKHCDVLEAQCIMQEFEDQGLSTQQFYRVLQESIGGRILVDKTPSYALDVEILKRAEEDFENALYIHLLRHPYGMIFSFEEAKTDQVFFRYEHSFSRRQLAEMVWLISQQNILKFLQDVPSSRHMRIRFEDLVSNPQTTVEGICAFLGLDFHPEMLQPYQETKERMTDGIHPLSKMLGDVKFHEHTGIEARIADRWQKEYGVDFLSEMTWRVAESLGYKRSTAPIREVS